MVFSNKKRSLSCILLRLALRDYGGQVAHGAESIASICRSSCRTDQAVEKIIEHSSIFGVHH